LQQNLFEPVSDYRMDFLVLEKRLALVPQLLVVRVMVVRQLVLVVLLTVFEFQNRNRVPTASRNLRPGSLSKNIVSI